MPAATRLMVRALGSSIAEGIGQIEAESYDFRGDAVELGPSMVLVEVACAAINFPDLLMTCGGYQHKPSLPYTPGQLQGRCQRHE